MKINKDNMFKLIRCWECDAGEGFTDYFDSDVNVVNLMFWALGKGIIDKDKSDNFIKEYTTNKFLSLSDVLYSSDNYSIIQLGDNVSDDDYYKLEEESLKILAEFLSSSDAYIRRVILFIAGCHWSTEWKDIEGETSKAKFDSGLKIFKEKLEEYNEEEEDEILIEY